LAAAALALPRRDIPTHVTSKKSSTPATDAVQPAHLLARYRERLARLLETATAAAPGEPPLLRVAVESLLEDLNSDLLALYRGSEARRLKPKEMAIVVPALEKLRNVLRQRDARVRSMRDTLHKAVTVLPELPQAVRNSAEAGSS
jgi:hypothetical protein